jgi:colanic acid/amylovoran biosynthesis glycosyltransferase
VLYVLKRYPRLSETFIVTELLGLEARRIELGIDALLPAEEGVRHRETGLVQAPVRYVPRRPRLRQRQVLSAHLRIARIHPVRWTRLALARRGARWRRFVQAGIVAERARRERFTHLHAHFATASAEVARDAAALAGLPFTVTAHAKDIFHDDNEAHFAARVSGARTVVTVSHYNVDHLQRLLPGVPVAYIPNGMPLAELRRGVGGDGPVLCVARLVEKKGVDTLIAAMRELADAGSPLELELDIIGSGPLSETLSNQIVDSGLAGRVRLLGSKNSDEVHAAYQRCSMFVLPCRIGADGDRDGMPTVILEAMSRGVPVVSTDVIGIGEVVRHRRTGLLVPPDDPAALAVAIGELATNHELAERLGATGWQLVAVEFNPSESAVALATVFARSHHHGPGSSLAFRHESDFSLGRLQ